MNARAKYLSEVKTLTEHIAILRGLPLQSVAGLSVTRANEWANGQAWADARKREEDLINAQFEAVKTLLKTIANSGNGIIKGLGVVGRR